MGNRNTKRISYQQLEERYRNLEKRYEELQDLLFKVASCWTKKQSRKFAKFVEFNTKNLNRKLTQKDLERARRIIEEHKDSIKELLEGINE